jgi:NTP pyrophosphatase (non-canonical NTP hydrolase)
VQYTLPDGFKGGLTMTEAQASYTTAPPTVMIELADMDLGGYKVADQAAKVTEEWDELKAAFDAFLRSQVGRVNMADVAEEAFDLMQVLAGYLDMLGVDIEAANGKHLAKVWERGNKPRGRER